MQTITAFADFLYFSRKRNVLRNAYNPLERLIISAVDLGVISSLLMMSVNDVLKQKYYQLQHLSCNIQQVYKKHIVNIQQMCLYNTNTIITSMTIKT